jgi:hypothetical protein
MGSAIGTASGLQPIDQSQPVRQSHSSQTPALDPSVSPSSDRVEISSVPSSSQVELVSSTAEFKTVVANAELDLRTVASQTGDPQEAAYLLDLANRFQMLQDAAGPSMPSTTAPAKNG